MDHQLFEIPVDIIYSLASIFSDSSDHTSLAQCSLVCRTWQLIFQQRIFAKPHLSEPTQLISLSAALETSPGIRPFVRGLTVRDLVDNTISAMAFVKMGKKLSETGNLNSLAIFRSGFSWQWAMFSGYGFTLPDPRTDRAWMDILFDGFLSFGQHLTSLSLSGMPIFPAEILEACPRLVNVKLSNVVSIGQGLLKEKAPAVSNKVVKPSEKKQLQWQILAVHGCHNMTDSFWRWILDPNCRISLSKLQQLAVDATAEYKYFLDLLMHCKDSLEALSILPPAFCAQKTLDGYPGYPFGTLRDEGPQLTRLRSLMVQIEITNPADESGRWPILDSLLWVQEFLIKTLAHKETLEYLRIRIPFRDATNCMSFLASSSCWSEFDSFLLAHGFTSLKEVRLDVFVAAACIEHFFVDDSAGSDRESRRRQIAEQLEPVLMGFLPRVSGRNLLRVESTSECWSQFDS